jgi:hypothetical protein
MASSFNIFRKNQKLMLAILTLLAMFAFVFLDPIFRYLGSNQAAPNPVMVETKYGPLKRSGIPDGQPPTGGPLHLGHRWHGGR